MTKKERESKKAEEQVDRWMDCVREGKPLPTASQDRMVDSPDWWKPENVDPEVESAISGFLASKTALASLGDDDSAGAEEVGVYLQLALLLESLPEHYVVMDELDSHNLDAPVWVKIPDLYEQLSKGAVKVTVSVAVFGVPVGLVTSFALRDERTVLELPLKAVVEGLGENALMQRVPGETQHYDTESLPTIFDDHGAPSPADSGKIQETESADSVELEAAEKEQADVPTPVKEIDDVNESTVSATEETCTEVTPEKPEDGPEVEVPAALASSETGEPQTVTGDVAISEIDVDPNDSRLDGVDLNTATVEQLVSLDGISIGLARDIIEHRNQIGSFSSVFDLAQVPGVGRKRFKRITGMAYSRTGTHRRDKLARLLDLPVEKTSHLPSVAEAIGAKPGLQGCVISDKDGLLLAESGIADESRTISAIVPRMLGQVRENMAELDADKVDTASISMRGHLLTIVDSGDVYLSVLHESNRLTSGMLKLVQRLARELDWLLSYRGYVGDPAETGTGLTDDA